MKEQVEKIINENPRKYSVMIKCRPELHNWVMENSTAVSEKYVDHIYCAVKGVTNVCPNGNHMKVNRWVDGLDYCGHVNKCACAKEVHSDSTKEGLSKVTEEQKANAKTQREITMTEKYGSAYNLQRPEVKEARFRIKIKNEDNLKDN
jgi:hypothetical protein